MKPSSEKLTGDPHGSINEIQIPYDAITLNYTAGSIKVGRGDGQISDFFEKVPAFLEENPGKENRQGWLKIQEEKHMKGLRTSHVLKNAGNQIGME